MLSAWPSRSGAELAAVFDRGGRHRILVSPAWLDESNKLRRFTVEVMRRLDTTGFDCFLPDLPGQNESLALLSDQTLKQWSRDLENAAVHFRATHCLTIRAGSNISPALPGWDYAPLAAQKQLKSLLRARVLAAREAGRAETSQNLMVMGQQSGLDLAGYRFGAAMIGEMATTKVSDQLSSRLITQDELPGSGLWLRTEPDHDAAQADALAAIIASDLLI